MKIVRGGFGAGDAQGADALGLDGDYAFLILQFALDQQKLLVHDEDVICVEKLRRDDGVGDAGFIFDAEKDESFGGAGALARDHSAGDANLGAIGKIAEFDGGANALPFHLRAMVSHGMRADGHPVPRKSATSRSSGVIGESGD